MKYMKNVKLLEFKINGLKDSSKLISYEKNTGLDFEIKRVYTVSGVRPLEIRGNHSHLLTNQIFVCVNGAIEVYLEDLDGNSETVILKNDGKALYCGNNIWHSLKYIEDNSILLVLADQQYDEKDYVRNYDDFKRGTNENKF